MRKYILIALFMTGCSSEQGEWYVHFVDGSEIKITQPSMVDREKGCASRRYIVPTEDIIFSSTDAKIKAKNMKIDGYTYRTRHGFIYVPFCDK